MDCLFCNIAAGKIPATVVFETPTILVFRDIQPQAPTHLLIIPKRHIGSVNDLTLDESALAGEMLLVAKHITHAENICEQGYRLVFNTNDDGGQSVPHLHMHVLGGRKMTWPPG
jgi:histidine triad (HIT) family protein